MNIEALYQIYSSNYLITTDTRDIKRGAIFFSLQGDHFNGNKFAEIAAGEASTFTTLFGADLVYDIGKIRLQVGYDFVIANPKYDVKFIDVSSGTTDSYVWDQSLSTYNFNLGLGYHF